MRIPLFETRVPASAIALFVRKHGAVYSSEILDAFLLSESTLRRRRAELLRLGLVFVENGRGSYYVTAALIQPLPTACLPEHAPTIAADTPTGTHLAQVKRSARSA